MKKNLLYVSLFFVFCIISVSANASNLDDFPKRPLKIICPWGTGGGSDLKTRTTAAMIEPWLDVSVSVTNVPGGGGAAGLAELVARDADGYTISNYVASTHANVMQDKIELELGKDFIPLARMQVARYFLFTHPKAPWDNAEEALKYIKENPKEIIIAGEAREAPDGYIVKQMETQDNLKVKNAFYADPGSRYSSVVGGHNDLLIEQMGSGSVPDYVEAGRLIPILIFAEERSSEFPDIPTSKEVGLENYDHYMQWRSYVIKAGTPKERIEWWVELLEKLSEYKKWKEHLSKYYMDPNNSFLGPDEFENFLMNDAKYWE